MASRRVQSKKAKPTPEDLITENEDDELEFMPYQLSSESDDPEFEKTLMAKYAAIKREKEKKFLKTAYNQLNQDLSGSSDVVKARINKIEPLFADFLLRYASCEDRIRNLLGQILTEQQKLLTLADNCGAANVEAGKKVEAGHISGLSRAKSACHEFQEVINKIVPQTL